MGPPQKQPKSINENYQKQPNSINGPVIKQAKSICGTPKEQPNQPQEHEVQRQVRSPCQPRPQRSPAAYVQEQRELAWTECVKNALTGIAELAWSIMMGSSGMDDTLVTYVNQIRKLQKKTYYITASESIPDDMMGRIPKPTAIHCPLHVGAVFDRLSKWFPVGSSCN